jgi:hypothetical protein
MARRLRKWARMSVNLHAIQHPAHAPRTPSTERTRASDGARSDFSAVLDEGVAAATSATTTMTRRPAAPDTPVIPAAPGSGRTLPDSTSTGTDPASTGNEVTSQGTLSDDPHTAGMYVPPDFYHGSSYSPVFDHQDENGNWVATPRFEGQKVYSEWRGSLPADYDPNARTQHDPLNKDNGPDWWKQDASGNWVKRDTGYGGIPLNDDGTPRFTPDPSKYPEYFVAAPGGDDEKA